MDKDFDFDNIGKRTPYRTPDNFFEETQRKILERTQEASAEKDYSYCDCCSSSIGRDFVYAVSPLYEYRHTICFKYIGCR